jgi:uncharacterized membrane protein
VEFALFALVVLGVIFVLPLALWVALYRTRTRIVLLEEAFEEQKRIVQRLSALVAQQKRGEAGAMPAAAAPQPADEVAPPAPSPPIPATPPVVPTPAAPPAPAVPLPITTPILRDKPSIPPSRPTPVAPPAPDVARPSEPRVTAPSPSAAPPAGAPAATTPPSKPPAAPGEAPAAAAMPAADRPVAEGPARPSVPAEPTVPPRAPVPPRVTLPPPPPPPPEPERPSFDWESLVGVKLFSAIAGIALVIAAVLFLRYSIQQGWLQPPIRVLIGIAVAVALLVVCELKAARNYPWTANALDAAAIAILFATFFAAHALWNLIPALVTFALLAAVTALAVLLSIRRESMFIAILGLLGGFATPALLSTGENRPIPLFAYLALLNIGLAWVAYRQVWPALTVLTLVLTTMYQWVWVQRYLSASQLGLAMSIFAIFPVLSVGALLFARRGQVRPRGDEDDAFERTTVLGAALPLVFVAYLATVPEYGARPGLLFGFLLLIDAGLFAVTVALGRRSLHTVGALATLLVWAIWLGTSYNGQPRLAMAFVSAFVLEYLFAPSVARWFSRPMDETGERTAYAAPALLFVFPVIAGIDPAAESPLPFFGPLLILVVLCAWRAVALDRGGVFFVGSFLGVAAQAVWSATHLTIEHLPAAVTVYAAFGAVSTAVPVIARRIGQPLRPQAGGAAVLLASLGLLLFLSTGPIAPAALWALALLLAILNAGVFIESASARVPLLSQIGTVLSWIILAIWWLDTAGAVGILPSLAVLTGLSLITFAGHAWAFHSELARTGARTTGVETESGFARGLYLAMLGHVFLFFVSLNREWSIPPWPVFGTLLVITLAATVTSASVRAPMLHVLGIGAAAVVLAAWTAAASLMPWTLTGLLTSVVLSGYALAWVIAGARLPGGLAAAGAAVALFGSEITAILAASGQEAPPFFALLVVHVLNLAVLLTLASQAAWRLVSAGALAIAWTALLEWQLGHPLGEEWRQLLTLAAAFYLAFTSYALIVGPRRPQAREPWLVALGAAAMTFFGARDAFEAGELEWMIGVVPVAQGLVTAFLLRALLRIERSGERDMTRLALVAGVALGFVTVAIPLQLDHQWITIGWALEAAALAWLYQRVPHRGLLAASAALFVVVFARLALNAGIWTYEPRGTMRIFNWYLYTYLLVAGSMLLAAWFFHKTNDRLAAMLPRISQILPAGAVILLFILLNIEIADYYATGPEITFRFGENVPQDLTYTIGWLLFGMLLLTAGIYMANRPARVTAVTLIAVTTFKCFLYDLGSLEGLYRIASFVGLAIALALVSLALQKYVLAKPKRTA